jgi:hypothetical protein
VLQFSHRGRPRSGSEDNYMHPLNIDKPAKPVACRPDSPTLDDYIVIPKEVPLDSSGKIRNVTLNFANDFTGVH